MKNENTNQLSYSKNSQRIIVAIFLQGQIVLHIIKLISKNTGPVLLFKIILRHWNCLLSSVATDGKDHGHGLKLEKIGPTIPSFNAMPAKNTPKKFSLMKFVLYLLHISNGAFFVWVKALSNDFSKEMPKTLIILIIITIIIIYKWQLLSLIYSNFHMHAQLCFTDILKKYISTYN